MLNLYKGWEGAHAQSFHFSPEHGYFLRLRFGKVYQLASCHNILQASLGPSVRATSRY